MGKKKSISRRKFIIDSAAAAVGSAMILGSSGPIFSRPAEKSRVVLIRNNQVLDASGNPKPDMVSEMLDQAVSTLVETKDPLQAWKSIIKPTDVVGIKSNVWSSIPTTSEVEQVIKKRVMDAGVQETDISIDDRGVKTNPVFLRATALINARPMRSHHWSGVGSLIKNYITFEKNLPKFHPDSCADLALIWKTNPMVIDKTRLNILVMLTPQFHSAGPHGFSPRYVWHYNGFIVGFDPVAVDATGLGVIEAKRKEHFREDRPLSPPAKHIQLADTRHGLGNADPANIQLITLGDSDNRLI